MAAVAERPALYALHRRQLEALRTLGLTNPSASEPVEELLYGGQAGGGKSHLLRALAVLLCQYWPGTVVTIFRRTYPELEETHIRAIRREVPPDVAAYNETRHELRFPNGSVLEFRYCQRESDVYQYQSAEWEALLIDEATHFTGPQVAYLRTRVRSTRPGWRPVIVYATNPGNVGHLYFKTQFVDAAKPETPFVAPKEDGGLRRFFLPARLEDNPSLGDDYRRMLEGLPDPAERAALLEGSWDVFAGQFFAAWRRDLHTCEPFELPAHWTHRGLSVDFGYGAPWSAHFWARDEDAWRADGIERWYAYREFYATKVLDTEQAALLAEAIAQDEARQEQARQRHLSAPEKLRWTKVGDPAMWNRKPMSTESVEKVYRTAGVHLKPANNDRVNGWQCARTFLALRPDGRPGVVYFRDRCPEAIRTIPSLVYDRTNPEDIQEGPGVEDHSADELRYWVMSGCGGGDFSALAANPSATYDRGAYATAPDVPPMGRLPAAYPSVSWAAPVPAATATTDLAAEVAALRQRIERRRA